MAKPPTVEISSEELDTLFRVLEIWSKIHDKRLTSAAIPSQRLPSHAYPGAVSDILRHENSASYHVATTHRITGQDGSVPHWDAKDIHIGNIVIWTK